MHILMYPCPDLGRFNDFRKALGAPRPSRPKILPYLEPIYKYGRYIERPKRRPLWVTSIYMYIYIYIWYAYIYMYIYILYAYIYIYIYYMRIYVSISTYIYTYIYIYITYQYIGVFLYCISIQKGANYVGLLVNVLPLDHLVWSSSRRWWVS